jgi:hypothetical protein
LGSNQRRAERHLMPTGISASLAISPSDSVVVILRDVSRHGACVARANRLELPPGSIVRLDVHDRQSGESFSTRAKVRWVRFGGFNTYIGLLFIPGPMRPGSMLERYVGGGASAG